MLKKYILLSILLITVFTNNTNAIEYSDENVKYSSEPVNLDAGETNNIDNESLFKEYYNDSYGKLKEKYYQELLKQDFSNLYIRKDNLEKMLDYRLQETEIIKIKAEIKAIDALIYNFDKTPVYKDTPVYIGGSKDFDERTGEYIVEVKTFKNKKEELIFNYKTTRIDLQKDLTSDEKETFIKLEKKVDDIMLKLEEKYNKIEDKQKIVSKLDEIIKKIEDLVSKTDNDFKISIFKMLIAKIEILKSNYLIDTAKQDFDTVIDDLVK